MKDFFSKCDQIRWKQRIWSHLLNKSLTENFIFCAVLAICPQDISTYGNEIQFHRFLRHLVHLTDVKTF